MWANPTDSRWQRITVDKLLPCLVIGLIKRQTYFFMLRDIAQPTANVTTIRTLRLTWRCFLELLCKRSKCLLCISLIRRLSV
jgi:hypothetical protein